MSEYLADFFCDDLTKSYYYIAEKTTAKLRQRSRASFRIKGCMDQVLIAAIRMVQLWTSKMNLFYTVNSTKLLIVLMKTVTTVTVATEVDDNDEQGENGISSLQLTRSEAIYEMVTEGSYVALRSMASSVELFFLAKVISKNVAYSNVNDGYGHEILAAEKYLTGGVS